MTDDRLDAQRPGQESRGSRAGLPSRPAGGKRALGQGRAWRPGSQPPTKAPGAWAAGPAAGSLTGRGERRALASLGPSPGLRPTRCRRSQQRPHRLRSGTRRGSSHHSAESSLRGRFHGNPLEITPSPGCYSSRGGRARERAMWEAGAQPHPGCYEPAGPGRPTTPAPSPRREVRVGCGKTVPLAADRRKDGRAVPHPLPPSEKALCRPRCKDPAWGPTRVCPRSSVSWANPRQSPPGSGESRGKCPPSPAAGGGGPCLITPNTTEKSSGSHSTRLVSPTWGQGGEVSVCLWPWSSGAGGK